MSALVSSGTPAHLNSIPLYWNPNTVYDLGDTCSYNSKMWRCLILNSLPPSEGVNWTSKFTSLSDDNIYAVGTAPYSQSATGTPLGFDLLASNLASTNPIPFAEATLYSTFVLNAVGTVTTAQANSTFTPDFALNGVTCVSTVHNLAVAGTYFFNLDFTIQIISKVGNTYTCICSGTNTVGFSSGGSPSSTNGLVSTCNFSRVIAGYDNLTYSSFCGVANAVSQTVTLVRTGLTFVKTIKGV